MCEMSTVYPLSKSFAQIRWQNWILEKVEWDESEWIPRQACIEVFVKYGLWPFLQANGLVCACNQTKLGEFIARYIYYGRANHAPLNVDSSDEEYTFYYFQMGDEKWEKFWDSWSLWSDLKDEHPWVREGIRHCVWTVLDIDASPAFAPINSYLSDSEDEDGGGGRHERRGDPYIADAAAGYFSYP